MRDASGSDFSPTPMHMYTDLAPWFHLLTHPSDYEDEAAFVSRVVDDVAIGEIVARAKFGNEPLILGLELRIAQCEEAHCCIQSGLT